MPWACDDMTDEEFDARMAALHSAFHDGLDEAISSQPASKMKKSAGGHHE
jgi:predicted N-formylglutamate amidohydrolase